MAGESAEGRKIVVQRIRSIPKPRSCQVLFISRSEKDVRNILSGLGPGVLTVSDHENFLHEGGMIEFILVDRHVRFDINQRVAVNGALSISARLLNVARAVTKTGR